MSSAKWSGIEQHKYNLVADWYGSIKYGYDADGGSWGMYDATTNPDGWGGPKRPFGPGVITSNYPLTGVVVLDSGRYTIPTQQITVVGDGDVILFDCGTFIKYYNVTCVSGDVMCSLSWADGTIVDCKVYGAYVGSDRPALLSNSIFEGCYLGIGVTTTYNIYNCTFILCNGMLKNSLKELFNCVFIGCQDLTIAFQPGARRLGYYADFSVIIGTVKSDITISNKAPGEPLTIEDFKSDGRYFRKSYSEVDLFGNVSGSGATVEQLNRLFNNFYFPYIDDWQYLDLSLKPGGDERLRYGGLNGHFIGALPMGYNFSALNLWNNFKDVTNTSNLILNVDNKIVRIDANIPGVFTSTIVTLDTAIEADINMFFKNNVYDSTGLAVQRLDYGTDDTKDDTLIQRTVYSYRMKISPDLITPLSDWKEYEIDRAPTVDADGNSNVSDLFDVSTQQKQIIKRFIIEVTLVSL